MCPDLKYILVSRTILTLGTALLGVVAYAQGILWATGLYWARHWRVGYWLASLDSHRSCCGIGLRWRWDANILSTACMKYYSRCSNGLHCRGWSQEQRGHYLVHFSSFNVVSTNGVLILGLGATHTLGMGLGARRAGFCRRDIATSLVAVAVAMATGPIVWVTAAAGAV